MYWLFIEEVYFQNYAVSTFTRYIFDRLKFSNTFLKFCFPFSKGPPINYVVSRGEGVKNCQFYLVKRQLRGGRGSKIADVEPTYPISSYSFRTFMYCDLWISKFLSENRGFRKEDRNWSDKFWGIWGIFGQTISTYFGTVSPFSMFSMFNHYFYKKLSLFIHIPNTYL